LHEEKAKENAERHSNEHANGEHCKQRNFSYLYCELVLIFIDGVRPCNLIYSKSNRFNTSAT